MPKKRAQDALWTAARKISTFKGESAFELALPARRECRLSELRARRSKSH
jgi:hypothetical protein